MRYPRVMAGTLAFVVATAVIGWQSSVEPNDATLPPPGEVGARTLAAMRAFNGTVTIEPTVEGGQRESIKTTGRGTFPIQDGDVYLEAGDDEETLPYPQDFRRQSWVSGGTVHNVRNGVSYLRWEHRTLRQQTDIWIDPATYLPAYATEANIGYTRLWSYQWNEGADHAIQ